jgi:glucuronate isomerase
MKTFINENFLLTNKTAIKLYNLFAKELPIIDFHNHLSPKEISENRKFDTITKAWLEGDHYKWRAMRAAGIDEKFITGNASDEEKFKSWAATVPLTLRNPLYHWTHLELIRYFETFELLNEESASTIYHKCNDVLNSGNNNVQDLLIKVSAEIICTTDDPVDSLEYHKALNGNKKLKVLPSFRPDNIYAAQNVEQYNNYLNRLELVSGIEIRNFKSLIEAVQKRHDFFHSLGCRVSDHGLDYIPYAFYKDAEIEEIFLKARSRKSLTIDELQKFQLATLVQIMRMNYEKNWVQQLHIGAIRNNNERQLAQLGPNTGYDSIGDIQIANPLAFLLNKLDKENKLAKTIGYNLNPMDNDLMITMLGNFNDGKIKGKMQYGASWWFLDQKQGIERQINDLSVYGLLHLFVGMVTDSRSFLSFPRHEYFRRILCNILGEDIEKGTAPNDMQLIGDLIKGVCYHNAKEFFNWDS